MLRSRETNFNSSKKKMTDVACFHGQHFRCSEGILKYHLFCLRLQLLLKELIP